MRKRDNEHKGRQFGGGGHGCIFVCVTRVCECSSRAPSETEGSEREMHNTWRWLWAPTQTLTAHIPNRPPKTKAQRTPQTEPAYSHNTKQTNNLTGLHAQTEPQPAPPAKTGIPFKCNTEQTQIPFVCSGRWRGGRLWAIRMWDHVYSLSHSHNSLDHF